MTACDYLKRLSSTNCEKMFASRTQSQSNRDEFCRNTPRRSIHQRCHSLSNTLIPFFNSICRYPYNHQTIIEDKEEDKIISPVAVKPQSLSYISRAKKYSNESGNDAIYDKYPLRIPNPIKQSIPGDKQNDAMIELLEIFAQQVTQDPMETKNIY
ncbi:hypothetical protein BCR32DRAFT_325075 [Anaeromyces robustus]|uniref:Uncharacterized protein n=1 Tax=Anaeromyces robustus TaxID=1754192 RepID=A0A1Y1XKA0_9FUNG|nr:hypothetical protein BCR32DRAFT_325075 [Anaeromyces robustus]|eukprot:ORX86187.1 hypothetical protein BCR32DRAFT_325075 [Anaeromyces robustus]